MAEKKAPDAPPLRNTRLQVTGIMVTKGGADGSIAAPSAARPSTGVIRPNPVCASMRNTCSLAALPAEAIPTSAHAPHCTAAPLRPWARRLAARASRLALAAL